MFKIDETLTLFADSLKAKNKVDWQIDQIKNDRDPNRAKQLDDYRLAMSYIVKNYLVLTTSQVQSLNHQLFDC